MSDGFHDLVHGIEVVLITSRKSKDFLGQFRWSFVLKRDLTAQQHVKSISLKLNGMFTKLT